MRRLTAWMLAAAGMLFLVSAAGAAFPGRNGTIVFQGYGTDRQNDIYAVETDGSGERRLTNWDRPDLTPKWSPDGKRIAFTRRVDRVHTLDEQNLDEIFVMDADGSGLVRVTNNQPGADFRPDWSPDGRRLVYVRNLQIATVSDAGGRVSLLTCDRQATAQMPTWSPDGRWIAYVRSQIDGSGSAIALVSPSGEPGPVLTRGYAESLDWSPDGSRILFVRHGELWTVPAEGEPPTRLYAARPGVSSAAWSPDGRFVVFSDGGQLHALEVSTGTVRRITSGGVNKDAPDWQPLGGEPIAPLPDPGRTPCDRSAPPPPTGGDTTQPTENAVRITSVRLRPGRPRAGRAFRLAVRVRDAEGRPVAGVRVWVSTSRPRLTSARGTATFRLRARRPGTLVLTVRVARPGEAASARRRVSVRIAPRR